MVAYKVFSCLGKYLLINLKLMKICEVYYCTEYGESPMEQWIER